jgi:hypothetical protein
MGVSHPTAVLFHPGTREGSIITRVTTTQIHTTASYHRDIRKISHQMITKFRYFRRPSFVPLAFPGRQTSPDRKVLILPHYFRVDEFLTSCTRSHLLVNDHRPYHLPANSDVI